MKSEPPSIHSRDPLRLAKERYEKQQDQIGIDHTLQFEVTRKILAIDPAQTRLKLQRGVQRVDTFGTLPSAYNQNSLKVSYYCEY